MSLTTSLKDRQHIRHTRGFWLLDHTAALMVRSVIARLRNPASLADVTLQPFLFVVLFSYVFGPSIALPPQIQYHDYLVSGLFAVTMAGTIPGTAVGISVDLKSGFVERLRVLPTARTSVLAARTFADMWTNCIGVVVVAVSGYLVGWRVNSNLADIAKAIGLILLFGYSMSWIGVLLGMLIRSPEGAQSLGMAVVLPMSFLSNSFLPTDKMPRWVRAVTNWNPISSMSSSCRQLFGMRNFAPLDAPWPIRFPHQATLIWCLGTLVLSMPIATLIYRKRST
jgi:ABC-2 type transport system permease protein